MLFFVNISYKMNEANDNDNIINNIKLHHGVEVVHVLLVQDCEDSHGFYSFVRTNHCERISRLTAPSLPSSRLGKWYTVFNVGSDSN